VWLEGLGKLEEKKIYSPHSGLELTTFQLVALCLNELHYHVPTFYVYIKHFMGTSKLIKSDTFDNAWYVSTLMLKPSMRVLFREKEALFYIYIYTVELGYKIIKGT
jgi:hypothetical protein